MAVAVPIPASWFELDAAIDAAAEDFDTEVRQKVITRLFPPQQKKAKTMAVAVPIPASSAELDAAIDAAAEDFDTEVRQKVIAHLFPPQQSPVVQPIDTTPAPDQAIDPTPAANVTSTPASLDPVPTAANTTPGASMKKKPFIAPLLTTVPFPSADLVPVPTTATEEVATSAVTASSLQSLDDLFAFDIGQYLHPTDADVQTSSALPSNLNEQLTEILARLDFPVDTLINDAGPIRSRIEEIQDQLPDNLIDAIAPTCYILIGFPSTEHVKESQTGLPKS
ncbi:uncharacterized protein LOC102707707 isoform X3 [Oryza brachyantha]|uniref:uncharacterized protein LOC102707707 isoform X3 n=1 Tax=Oryza brachyantha TaxID=4533 RepID=UPI001ADD251F|nr:uncharacterized protein LOC102707707 isoform X3 [Oryza brachyantha]